MTKTQGDDGTWAFFDSHNLFVQILVTLGLIGLLLFVLFLAASLHRSSGATVWMAGAMFLTWQLQPAVLQTWPVGLALLGAGSAALAPRVSSSRLPRFAVIGALLVGAFLASSFLAADEQLQTADVGRPLSLPASMWMYSHDSVVASSMSDGGFDPSVGAWDAAEKEYVLTWAKRATQDEPDFPLWWSLLALRALRYDELDLARHAAERGIEIEPKHIPSWQALKIVGQRTGDQELVDRADHVLCTYGFGSCAGSSNGQ